MAAYAKAKLPTEELLIVRHSHSKLLHSSHDSAMLAACTTQVARAEPTSNSSI